MHAQNILPRKGIVKWYVISVPKKVIKKDNYINIKIILSKKSMH
jgi:hypothetical protein